MRNSILFTLIKFQSFKSPLSSSLFLIFSLSLLVACGSPSPQRWKQISAPTSQESVGVLVEGASVEDMKTLESSGGTIREIYAHQGIYEIYGLSDLEVEALIDRRAYKNKFTPRQNPSPVRLDHSQKKPDLSDPVSCMDVDLPPFHLTSSFPEITEDFRKSATIRRGAKPVRIEVKFLTDQTLPYEFILAGAPPPSKFFSDFRKKQKPPTVLNRALEFLPDEMGEYRVILYFKFSEIERCGLLLTFGVTDDVEYAGPGGPVEVPLRTRLLQFPHLGVIGAHLAWPSTQGEGVTLAIIDSGVDYNHEFIRASMKVNSGEIPGNLIDDDGNDLVDDVVGYDFVHNDPFPYDDLYHGTFIAGLASSAVGVAPKSKIIAIKAMSLFGTEVGTLGAAVRYAVDQGAQIINLSVSSENIHPFLEQAIDYAESKNVLVVTSSGNRGANLNREARYPVCLANRNVFGVGGTDLRGNWASYANYGDAVDIAAPAGTLKEPLKSLMRKNAKGWKFFESNGTSFSTPLVAGAAALVLSSAQKNQQSMSAIEIQKVLIEKGTHRPDYAGKVGSLRFLNLRFLGESQSRPRP